MTTGRRQGSWEGRPPDGPGRDAGEGQLLGALVASQVPRCQPYLSP